MILEDCGSMKQEKKAQEHKNSTQSQRWLKPLEGSQK